MECTRCGHVLVDEDEAGWYYQQPVTRPEAAGLTFMDRVHECDGKPHEVSLQAVMERLADKWASHATFLDGRAEHAQDGKAVLLLARAQAHQDLADELRETLVRVLGSNEEG